MVLIPPPRRTGEGEEHRRGDEVEMTDVERRAMLQLLGPIAALRWARMRYVRDGLLSRVPRYSSPPWAPCFAVA